MAALAICESLLLSLTDNKIIEQREMEAILRDAATAHREAARLVAAPQQHQAAAVLIEGILTGGNSVRRGMSSDQGPDGAGLSGDGAVPPAGRVTDGDGRPDGAGSRGDGADGAT